MDIVNDFHDVLIVGSCSISENDRIIINPPVVLSFSLILQFTVMNLVPLPVTEINWGSDILMAWLSNYIDIKLWDAIALSLMVVHQRWC